jgi:ribonucleoside-diphosphate reductase alpha chain
MMAATQPFISGAISKTINMPENATVEDIAEAYMQAWRLGLKAVAIYRDGCKKSQPMVVKDDKNDTSDVRQSPSTGNIVTITVKNEPQDLAGEDGPPLARRHRLPGERASITHKFNIAGHEGYITVGMYKDGAPGELFIRMAKEGSTVSGLMDAFALAVSLALQHGVPLRLLCEKFTHTRFEPSGFTGNPEIPIAKSLMDYIFRWLEIRFVQGQQFPLFPQLGAGAPAAGALNTQPAALSQSSAVSDVELSPEEVAKGQRLSAKGLPYHAADAMKELVDLGDAPSCHLCGSIMTRNGSCYRCMSCGSTSGCS